MQQSDSVHTPQENSPKADASNEKAPLGYGSLIKKRNAFKRKLTVYLRTKVRITTILDKEETEKSSPEPAGEEALVNKELFSYKLLRNFCMTYNWLTLKKEDEKRAVPELFEQDLISMLG